MRMGPYYYAMDTAKEGIKMYNYVSKLSPHDKEELLKTGYLDTQLRQHSAYIIHQDEKNYNEEQKNVINYLFKKKQKSKKMPFRQRYLLDYIIDEVNAIKTAERNTINDKNNIFVISDIEGDVYSLLRFLKHIGVLQSIHVTIDKNGSLQIKPSWNSDFNAKIVFDGDHTSCRSFFNKECVDVLLSLQEKFSKNNIYLVKGNHEYNIPYDGAEKGSVLYDAKKRIYDKCMDIVVIQSGKNVYHFMHSANFALARAKDVLPDNFNASFNADFSFPRTYQMNDIKITAHMQNFQHFLRNVGFKHPQNHHIVFGHDIDYNKTISNRLKKYGMLPVDNENKNYFCISNDKIIEYDNNTGMELESYKIANPLLINSQMYKGYDKYRKYYNPVVTYKNAGYRNITNKNIYNNATKKRAWKNKYNNTMKKLFLNTTSNNRSLNGYYLPKTPKYF